MLLEDRYAEQENVSFGARLGGFAPERSDSFVLPALLWLWPPPIQRGGVHRRSKKDFLRWSARHASTRPVILP